jgi:hypothetical protein
MPRVISYGEDALTYWALTEKLGSILQKLEDKSDPPSCLVIYRPSFGRRGGPGRAEFGEFDAILATSRSIYLIESKWGGSSEIKEGIIKVRKEQVDRHRIFAWYFRRWRKNEFQSWLSFVKRYEAEFSKKFDGKKIAPSGSKLSRNLEYVINQLHGYTKEISNVLLFFRSEGTSPPTRIVPRDFRLVIVDYQKPCGSDYLEIVKPRMA